MFWGIHVCAVGSIAIPSRNWTHYITQRYTVTKLVQSSWRRDFYIMQIERVCRDANRSELGLARFANFLILAFRGKFRGNRQPTIKSAVSFGIFPPRAE